MKEEIERLSSRVDSHEQTLKDVSMRQESTDQRLKAHDERIGKLEETQKKIATDTDAIHRGVYGDRKNKVVGLMTKINVLMLLHFAGAALIIIYILPDKVEEFFTQLFKFL